MSDTFYKAYRTYEGHKTAEIYRWDYEQAKAEIAMEGNIAQPEWRPLREWSGTDVVADGRHGDSQVVVKEVRVK